ncbi:MAG: asparagine synthase (glutamine-hydrolyzing) [Planctomycetes bacterium]|nr:asparagine synthase (glutamine-hydrolyzing) [Planctomycetota bacterium]
MCGIAGIYNTRGEQVPDLMRRLTVMGGLIAHRGPDGEGFWTHSSNHIGFAHRRLSIIDLSTGDQPMTDELGNWLVFNGEIYNYIELRKTLGEDQFRTKSDTEVILRAYQKWGVDCLDHLRGMFAFALWDERQQQLFCARDRFGIKPFYYSQQGEDLYFASEVKALLPFLPAIKTNTEALKEYLSFQFCFQGKTLFHEVAELQPGHYLVCRNGQTSVQRYWQVYYTLDFDHTEKYFVESLVKLFEDSVAVHCRADVPIGGYVSGGLDSSIVASMACERSSSPFMGFTGKFSVDAKYDESAYARDLAAERNFTLHEIDMTPADFRENIRKVIYHLDYPVAGPGSFPQYMVSQLASRHRKVVLGGQGGDEIFGGYVRYLIAYFEQCIKAAINGTANNGTFIVTYQSIIPNLSALRGYAPLMQEFWREGLFEDLDRRYFRLINRAPSLGNEIRWDVLGDYDIFETFRSIFRADNVGNESYFDSMTHFDFKTLLPALLQVEDRVSMAHGIESRVPFLDHPIVEFAATAPSNIKFQDGRMKHLLRNALGHTLPSSILNRKDKMGFPVPLNEWLRYDVRDFVMDTLTTRTAYERDFVDNRIVVDNLQNEPQFGRKIWGLLSLEIWQQEFHDKAAFFKGLLKAPCAATQRHAA